MIFAIVMVVLLFGSLVFVHELGHFLLARRNGVEVDEFGFGFPPRVVGKRVGRTLYSINLLPLGGFVRLKGEDSADTSAGSFGAATYWAKFKILLAGVGMNLLVAYLILLALCVTGLPPVIAGQVSIGNPTYTQNPQVLLLEVEQNSPAFGAGLRKGDTITAMDGQTMRNEIDLTGFTKAHAGQKVSVEYTHGDESKTSEVTLRESNSKEGYLGVTPLGVYKQAYGWWAPVEALALLGQLTLATLAGFGALIAGLFVHGQVSDQVTGPVGIVVILSNILYLGVGYVALFVASISLSLAVVNALPIPAMDGGRLFLITAAKVLRRPLSPRFEASVHATGFVALIALMAIVTFFDIKRLG